MSINLTLNRIYQLFAHLGPYTRPTIHIAGTNGKGSVAAFLSSILAQSQLQHHSPTTSTAGNSAHNHSEGSSIKHFKVGRFNSPHLLTPRDSIVIDNNPIPSSLYTRIRTQVESVDSQIGSQCSPFELLTAIALRAFEECQVGLVLLECGMGGRVDATNIVDWKWKVGAVITSVEEDHMAFLGGTVEEIAKEKVGILNGDGEPARSFSFSAGTKLVLGRQRWKSVEDVVKTFAREKGVEVVDAIVLDRPNILSASASNSDSRTAWRAHLPNLGLSLWGDSIPLAGDHQYDNLATALTVLDNLPTSLALSVRLTRGSIENGIKETKWRGRLERITMDIPLPPSDSSSTIPPQSSGSSLQRQRRSRRVNFLLDGAHNASSALSLASYLALLPHPRQSASNEQHRDVNRKFILSLSHSPPKTPHSTLSPLLRRGDTVFLTPFSTPEGMPWVKHVEMEELETVVRSLVGADWVEPASEPVERISSKVEEKEEIPDWQTEKEDPVPSLRGVELSGNHLTPGQVFVCQDVEDAMQKVARMLEGERERGEGGKDELVVISGSLYLVADALRYQEKLEGRIDS